MRRRNPVSWRTSAPFIVCHFLPLLGLWTGVHPIDLVLLVVLYWVRMFFITAGYHRYFAHKSYRTSRAMQFVLAYGGLTAVQQGPLWWAAHHRTHHKYTDTDRDPHSPRRGFIWSHVGWLLSGQYGGTNYEQISDFAKYPELRFLDRHDWIGPWSLAIACFLVGGWSGLFIGFFGSTVLLWHATFAVNSFAHVFGRRRYETNDLSRNSLGVALLTGGEGWHNNHHHYPLSARQGFYWWELDMTFLALRGLEKLGLVHDLREPTAAARDARRVTMNV